MKHLLNGLLLLITVTLVAQEQQPAIKLSKRWLVGGNGQLYLEQIGDQTGRLIFILEPQAGYFINQSFLVGLRTPLSFKSNEYELAALPFFRYYAPLTGDILPFVEANGGYGLRVIISLDDDEPNTYENTWQFGGRAGAAFFLSANTSLDLFLFYTGQNTSYEDSEPLLKQFFGLGVGFEVYLD